MCTRSTWLILAGVDVLYNTGYKWLYRLSEVLLCENIETLDNHGNSDILTNSMLHSLTSVSPPCAIIKIMSQYLSYVVAV